MIKQVSVSMDYIGSVLSVNHYKWGYYTRPETRAWMEELGWRLKRYHIEDWKLPLTVKCNGIFKDKRSCPDIHNCLKIICDSIQSVTNLNDRDFITQTGEPIIDKAQEPRLIITITGS